MDKSSVREGRNTGHTSSTSALLLFSPLSCEYNLFDVLEIKTSSINNLGLSIFLPNVGYYE